MAAVGDLQDVSDTLDSIVGNSADLFDYYSNGAVFYTLFGIVDVFIVLQLIFHFTENNAGMKAMVGCNNFMFLFIILFGMIWCTLAIILGDFCQAPSTNFVELIPAGEGRNVSIYFATCVGTSPLDDSLQSGEDTLNEFNSYLDLVQQLPGCGNSKEVQQMQSTVLQINDTIYDLYNITACSRMNSIYNQFVYSGTCNDVAEGIFYIWGSQLFTAIFMMANFIFSVYAYQFYAPVKESTELYYDGVLGDEEEAEGHFELTNMQEMDDRLPAPRPQEPSQQQMTNNEYSLAPSAPLEDDAAHHNELGHDSSHSPPPPAATSPTAAQHNPRYSTSVPTNRFSLGLFSDRTAAPPRPTHEEILRRALEAEAGYSDGESDSDDEHVEHL